MQWVIQNYEFNFCDSLICNSDTLPPANLLGPSTICDKNSGRLLFYTDGVSVLNNKLQLMPNGSNLAGGANSTQAALPVPQPGLPNIYYIFTTVRFTWPGGLEYSIIDMNKNGGLGDVTIKNVFLDSTTEKLNAVYNSQGDFFWIIALNPTTNNYMSFKLDSNGLNTSPVLSPSGVLITNEYQRSGYLKSSPNGSEIAVVFESNPYTIGLYSFNKDSGKLKLQTFLPLENEDDNAYSASFSPDNSKLYVTGYSSSGYSKIYQYDLSNSNIDSIKSSRIKLSSVSYNNYFEGMQMGPDGKIYINKENVDSISVIEKPNLKGLSCKFDIDKIIIPISTFNGVAGLSNNIDGLYYFASTPNITLTNSVACTRLVSFTINTERTYNYFSVNFGDGKNVNLDSTVRTFTHQYDSAGTYTVKLYTQIGCVYDSAITTVIIDTAKCPVLPQSLIIPTLIYGRGSQAQWHIINLPQGSNKVTLYDELGRVIYVSNNYPNDYDMRNLPPAMYFYRLTLENGQEYKGKIILIK